MQEIWKDIHGYYGLYKASNTGKIKSLPRRGTKGGILIPARRKLNYFLEVNLSKNNIQKTFLVHRLIMMAFHGKLKKDDEIKHKDGNVDNNYFNNLEIIKVKNLSEKDVIEIRKDNRNNEEISKIYGVDPVTIWRVKKNKSFKNLK